VQRHVDARTDTCRGNDVAIVDEILRSTPTPGSGSLPPAVSSPW
jgi:hypothetical protein